MSIEVRVNGRLVVTEQLYIGVDVPSARGYVVSAGAVAVFRMHSQRNDLFGVCSARLAQLSWLGADEHESTKRRRRMLRAGTTFTSVSSHSHPAAHTLFLTSSRGGMAWAFIRNIRLADPFIGVRAR